MKFIIDQSRWRCGGEDNSKGHGQGPTFLKNREGYMCCLGMCLSQCGATEGQILHHSAPSEVYASFPPFTMRTGDGWWDDTDLADTAMTINDFQDYSREEREDLLSRLFQKHGHEIEFVGEYEDTTNTGTT